MKWRSAYVLRELPFGDFSELYESCENVYFMYGPEKIESSDPQRFVQDAEEFLQNFDRDEDLLVLAGPSHLCVMAFSVLFYREEDVDIAVYKDGRYEFFRVMGRDGLKVWTEPVGVKSA